jgi:hypothetical protein
MGTWDWVIIFMIAAAVLGAVIAAIALSYCAMVERRERQQFEERLQHDLAIQSMIAAAYQPTDSLSATKDREEEYLPSLAATTLPNEVG